MTRLRNELHFNRLMACYADRPSDVNDMFARSLARSPDAVAGVDGSTRITYRELDRTAAAIASGLAAQGVRPGDRVAVVLANSLAAVQSVLAIARLGAAVVPIGTRLRRPEIEHIFSDSEPAAVVHGAEFTDQLPGIGPRASQRIAVGSVAWNALLASSPLVSHAGVAEEDLFGILYTSGTTGKPKGAMLTHFNVVHSCLHWEDVHRLQRGERTILCVPWSHVAGLAGVMLPFLHVGGTLVLMPEFKRREFLTLAQAERITHALMVPAMYGLCLLEADLASFDLREWRLGVYGSAPMPEPTIHRFAEAFPQLQMCNAYGATETTSPATIMPPGDGILHAESIGKIVPCGDIVVMDDAGRELPHGTGPTSEGELWIGGPMIVAGYWRNPEANADSFAGGYWKSGDIGAIDADGYVRIADRKKDMINRGGFKVYPAEVESALMGIEGVVEAAVVGHPDPILGESVIAFLNVNRDVDEASVTEFCVERMADYKVPGRVVIGRDPLPRNANGKIQKADLRATARSLPPLDRKPPPLDRKLPPLDRKPPR